MNGPDSFEDTVVRTKQQEQARLDLMQRIKSFNGGMQINIYNCQAKDADLRAALLQLEPEKYENVEDAFFFGNQLTEVTHLPPAFLFSLMCG